MFVKFNDTESFGKIMAETMKLLNENELVEMVYRYKRKQPILLKKGTRTHYPVFASADHPKSKEIHEWIIRSEPGKRLRFRGRPFPRTYHVHHPSKKKGK